MLLPLILFALMEILTCLHLPIISLRESPYQFLSFCFVAGAKKGCTTWLCQSRVLANPELHNSKLRIHCSQYIGMDTLTQVCWSS